MNQEKFLERYNSNDLKSYSKEEMIELLKKDIDGCNDLGQRKMIITVEELAELIQAVTKSLRGKEDRINALEEIGDVSICIEYLKLIHNLTDEEIKKAIDVKLERIQGKLEVDGFYK